MLTPPVRLVIYGDSRPHSRFEFWRENASDPRRAVIERIAAEKPALVVHSGDLTLEGGDPAGWSLFDREMAPIRDAGIPFFPALGNHEVYGNRAAAMAHLDARFPRLEGRRWYDLRAGPLAIVVLDTNLDEMPSAGVEQQSAWYGDRLAALDADPAVGAVFVVGHHPPITNATIHGPSAAIRARFVEPARAWKKVRAMFFGHVHAYERFEEQGLAIVVSGGGGAPRMEVRKDLRAHDLYAGSPIRPFHYCLVTVEEKRAVIDVMMLDEAHGTWARGDGFTVAW